MKHTTTSLASSLHSAHLPQLDSTQRESDPTAIRAKLKLPRPQ